MVRHETRGERLRALDRGGRRDRTERREARFDEPIGEPGDERRLRSHHGQVDPLALGERDEPVERVGGERNARGVARDTRIAGRGEEPLDAWALGDFPGQRVLPAAAADDEDPHCIGVREAGVNRGWPEKGTTRLCSATPRFIPTVRQTATSRGWPEKGTTRLCSATPLFIIPTARAATGSGRAARRARGGRARSPPT